MAFRHIIPRSSEAWDSETKSSKTRSGGLLFLRQRNHDLIFIPRTRAAPDWASLRIAEEVHCCPVFGRYKISHSQIERLAALLRAAPEPPRLIVTADGAHFARQEMRNWLSRELQRAGVAIAGSDARSHNASNTVYVFCIEQAYYVCLPRFSAPHAPLRDKRRAERPGSLPPTIAAAMAFLGKPRPDDVILDPVCGSGTLLAEAHVYARDATLLGMDTDPAALDAARQNLSHTGARLLPGSGADTALSPQSVSLFLANLPFGKQYGDRATNPQLYGRLLAEMVRLGKTNHWRAVLLSADGDALDKALSGHSRLTVATRTAVSVRGEKAMIVLVRPNASPV